jgi:hypothetical protein
MGCRHPLTFTIVARVPVTGGVLVVSAGSSSALRSQHRLDRSAFVHGAIALRDLIER